MLPASAPRKNVVPWVLAALLVAMATVRLPNAGAWLGAKAFAMEAAGILLALYVLSRGEWTRERVRAAVFAPPNLAILLFLGWVALSTAVSGYPEFSRPEAMRHLGGGLIYFAVVYGLAPRRQLGTAAGILALAGGLCAAVAFASLVANPDGAVGGGYHNEQLLAGVLLVLAPPVFMAARAEDEPLRRNAYLVALILMGIGIVVARNRSVWAGAAVATAVMAWLSWRYRKPDGRPVLRRHQVAPVLCVAVGGLVLFLGLSQLGRSLSYRADTITRLAGSEDLDWRMGMWSKGLRMALKRPLLGWGVGTFPINQALFFDADAPPRTQAEILRTGPTLEENAHNSYAQLSGELGFPGLLLYLGVFGAFFVTAGRALERGPRSRRRALLIGCCAAAAGQMVSAVGNPAWEFAQCSLFLWTVLGLGMAAAGVGEPEQASIASPRVAKS